MSKRKSVLSHMNQFLTPAILSSLITACSDSSPYQPQPKTQTFKKAPSLTSKLTLPTEFRPQHSRDAYDYNSITANLRVKLPIRQFSNISPEEINRRRRAYLNEPATQSTRLGTILNYFDERFPAERVFDRWDQNRRGDPQPLPQTNSLYMDPNLFVDYSTAESGRMPLRLNQISGATSNNNALLARRSIQNVITLAENSADNLIRYQLKRALRALNNPNLNDRNDKIKGLLIVLASAGQHCSDGMDDGARFIAASLTDETDPANAVTDPENFQEYVLHTMDQLREEVFREVINFQDNIEPAATEHQLRNTLTNILKIAPGDRLAFGHYFYQSMFYWDMLARTQPGTLRGPDLTLTQLRDLVYERFYNGKQGNPTIQDFSWHSPHQLAVNAETRRSHQGYTPQRIAERFFQADRNVPGRTRIDQDSLEACGWFQLLKNYARRTQSLDSMKLALLGDGDFVNDILDIEDLTPTNAQAGLKTLNEDYSEDKIIEFYTMSTYFISPFREGWSTPLNSDGIRQLLIEFQILEANS